VGEGPCGAEYERDVQRLGLGEQVEFLGYRYDVPELTAAADLVVLSSVKEGIPRSLMQAMAVGVPVVATDVKGTREVVVAGETGFLVPLDDAARFAERVAMLLDSAELRREMGARGVAHARLHFDEDRVVERLAGLYRTGLAARGLALAPTGTLHPAREGCS
jgi:glycosyltransferase involved in cell wall biosynthesis